LGTFFFLYLTLSLAFDVSFSLSYYTHASSLSLRSFVQYGNDESSGTYVTNYIVVVVILIGFAYELYSPPPASDKKATQNTKIWRRFSLHNILWFHLITYALSYLFAGLVHHLFFVDKCPGQELMKNETDSTYYLVDIDCPKGMQETGVGVWALAMLFQTLAVFQFLLVIVMVSGCAWNTSSPKQRNRCEQNWHIVVGVVEALAFVLAIYAASSHVMGWFVAGISSLILTPLLAIACIVGIVRAYQGQGVQFTQLLLLCSFCLSFVGLLIQTGFGGACGFAAYQSGDIARGSCPFPFDGRTGFNHNGVYHIFEIFAKAVLVWASRGTVLSYVEVNDMTYITYIHIYICT
jgi:hypothetical protein